MDFDDSNVAIRNYKDTDGGGNDIETFNDAEVIRHTNVALAELGCTKVKINNLFCEMMFKLHDALTGYDIESRKVVADIKCDKIGVFFDGKPWRHHISEDVLNFIRHHPEGYDEEEVRPEDEADD